MDDFRTEEPIVRIANSLEKIVCMLEKMANPPMMVRLHEETVEFGPEGAKVTRY